MTASSLPFFTVRNPDSLKLLAFILLFMFLGICYFPLTLFAIVALYGCFVCHVYIIWQKDFKAENRVPREDAASPSNKDAPALQGQFWTDIHNFLLPSKWEQKRREERKKRLRNAKVTPGKCFKCTGKSLWAKQLQIPRVHGDQKTFSIPVRRATKNDFGGCNPRNHLSEVRASKLDMDHVYLPFLDFLWGKTFISPCTSTLAMVAALGLLIKAYAIKRGIYTWVPFIKGTNSWSFLPGLRGRWGLSFILWKPC